MDATRASGLYIAFSGYRSCGGGVHIGSDKVGYQGLRGELGKRDTKIPRVFFLPIWNT